ncbi:methionyl-tRNA formyltransferase [Spirochaeta cellobiosiphila]|uniref:methionyl-tRNA formyltransferase n=1 Tax=Spirochaeta cellobiosiphila TaxID=504483 RepID=UPI0004073882|nr:methionyl-tRNA formyltransferase [Spirochaeta cellobiosiphila]
MRILFAGTPEIAVPSLEALAKAGYVAAVLTNPDRPQGRGRKLTPSPVKAKAIELGLPVFDPVKLKELAPENVTNLGVDLLVVFAYGKIFRESFINLFPLGGINLHPSRLPQFRGPSPLPETILSGLDQMTITVQKLALQMDAGDLLYQEDYPLSGHETTEDLTIRAGEEGAKVFLKVMEHWEEYLAKATPQDDSLATYCQLINKEDGLIDWDKDAITIDRQIRAYNPWPKAVTSFGENALTIYESHIVEGDLPGQPGEVLKVDKGEGILVKTGDGLLCITKLQLKGKKVLDYKSFLNGTQGFINAVLGSKNE